MQDSEEAFRRPQIAVVGCGHGGLDTIYADVAVKCQTQGKSVSDLDLLLICGDFQVSILLVVRAFSMLTMCVTSRLSAMSVISIACPFRASIVISATSTNTTLEEAVPLSSP
jgi:hypothetical protein